MITVFYYHKDRMKEYSKEFEEPSEALKFYDKMKHLKDYGNRPLYIVSYICTLSHEMCVMERIYK